MTDTASGNSGKIAFRVAIVAILVIALVIGIRLFTRKEIDIRAAKAGYGDLLSDLSTNGKVEPIQNFQAHAGEAGSVQAVYVRAGQQVGAGTLLLRMSTAAAEARVETARSAIAQARAAQFDVGNGGSTDERIGITGDLERARLQVAQSQKDLSALQALQAKGAASLSEVASAQSRLSSAQSSLDSLQKRSTGRYSPLDKQRASAQLADSQASLAAAQQSLSQSVVRAPFSGTVYSLPVKAYDFVGSGEELVQVADLTKMQVRAYFDEPEIGRLKLNDKVVIKWDAKPGLSWHGHIVRTPTTVITYGTRNVGECLIAVDDATGDLLPNTNVNVSVTTQSIYHVLSLPREALRTQGSESYVFLVQNNQLVKRVVKIGSVNLMAVQIVSGINPNDLVALASTSSSIDLSEGLRVRVVQQ
ncbi:RND family efflux transporter, MFP subunit [Terriglobus roseus DSM 18391]|uniref:RND family efflux transporter, MFP subunit n=1 Tax=Terriglobus roseus (strain DSM 18391 / NRRL B-41598 / KBS 63) TaxID=926566 RepID=I3ZFZ9_TERRK|nr:efflux RND transporter periplasmic adaptor subunit [Terriglobus roseus]AFL88167.1 RND family efflux transporter, MFP subunit [Terriglobus roseus DSM 18391]